MADRCGHDGAATRWVVSMTTAGGIVEMRSGCVPRILEGAIGGDPMFTTELLPKFATNLITTLSHLEGNDFTRHSNGVLLDVLVGLSVLFGCFWVLLVWQCLVLVPFKCVSVAIP